MKKTVQVRVTHQYKVPPETVFDAFLDDKRAGKFLFATPTGEMVRVEIDPRVGGKFRITDRRPGQGDIDHVGTYLEIDRPRRLVFSFGDDLAFDATTVTVEIVATGDGCELTLTHDGVGEEWAGQTNEGWTAILASLGGLLS